MKYVTIEAKTVEFLWHGTSSKNLKSILSKGLTPDGKYRHVTYKEGHYKSIHGLYLATSLQRALNYAELASKREYNKVLVLIKASYDNENFALDEDNINKYLFRGPDYKTVDDSFQAFVEYYLKRIKNNVHRSFIYTCNKNKKLITDWIYHDAHDDLHNTDEKERDYVRQITLLLGKFLTSKIKKYDSYFGHDENWKNVATNKAITYKGATRIIGVWVQANSLYGRKKEMIQVYGDKKYNILLQQRFKRYGEYKVLTELYGMDDYNLYNDIIDEKPINWNSYVKKHNKIPEWLNTYFTIHPDITSIPENFKAKNLFVNKDITSLPSGLDVDYLDLSLNDNITELPKDIKVKSLVNNRTLTSLPNIQELYLKYPKCIQHGLPKTLKKLDMHHCYENVDLPKDVKDIDCWFSPYQTSLPNGFRIHRCNLNNCEYMVKLPDNMTCDLLQVPPNLEKLPENLHVKVLDLIGVKNKLKIPSSANVKVLRISSIVEFPDNFSCEKLYLYNIKKKDLDLSHCTIKEIVEG